MCEPFIRNHQYNHIKKHASHLLHALRTVADRKVLESVRCGAETGVTEPFAGLTVSQELLLFVQPVLKRWCCFRPFPKKRPADSSPDYYKAVGNYVCMNSLECNKNISDCTALEKFLDAVRGT
mgnify:CR=1 FL=1